MIDIKELQQLRYLADDVSDQNEPYFDAATVNTLLDKIYAQQAEIDALMLEFCPNEMSKEQMEEWARHQRVSEYQPPEFKLIKQEKPWLSIDFDGQPKTAGFYDVLYSWEKDDAAPSTFYYDGHMWFHDVSATGAGMACSSFGNENTDGERYRNSKTC